MPYPDLRSWRATASRATSEPSASRATDTVSSVLPSSTSTISYPGASRGRVSAHCRTIGPMFSDSLCAGMTRLSDPSSIASQDSPARIQENRRDVVTMTPDEILREVARVRWFHRIDLGNGIVTPGEDNTPTKLATLGRPDARAGVTALYYGAGARLF